MSFLSNQPENINSKQGPGRNSLIRRAVEGEQSPSPLEGWEHFTLVSPRIQSSGLWQRLSPPRSLVPLVRRCLSAMEVPGRSGHHWGVTDLRRLLSATPRLLSIRLLLWLPEAWVQAGSLLGSLNCWLVEVGEKGRRCGSWQEAVPEIHPLASQCSSFR